MSISFSPSNSTRNSNEENGNGSRLSPFKRIPRIGYVNVNVKNELIPHPPSTRPNDNQKKFHHRSKHYLFPNPNANPSESNSSRGKQIQLAIRLINGKRLIHQFDNQQTIGDLIDFIQKKEKIDFNEEFFLSTAEIPKREFHQLNETIEQANIQDKTLLLVDRF